MKKLMIAAAIVCASALSHAATFSWSADDTQYMPYAIASISEGTFDAATSGNNAKIAKWVSPGGMDFTAAIFLSEDGVSWTPSAVESYELDTVNSIMSVDGVSNDLFVKPAEGSKTLYYKIVITGTMTDDSGTWTATGTIEDSFALASLDPDSFSSPTVASWDISFQGAGPGPVPEPTSGLLLLLGVAGLALRRRRA